MDWIVMLGILALVGMEGYRLYWPAPPPQIVIDHHMIAPPVMPEPFPDHAVKTCPWCCSTIHTDATRCQFCTGAV